MKKLLMTILATLLSVVITLVISNWVYGETAKDAYIALKKLEAKCQVGISYNNYFEALGDIQFDINMFLESRQAERNPELTESIIVTLDHYKFASTVLEYFYGNNAIIYHRGTDKDIGMDIIYKYPKSLNALVRTEDSIGLNPFKVLKVIWNEASEELTRATELLYRRGK